MLILISMPKWINNFIHMFLLWLDSIVYFFVSKVYQLFIYLSTARIFEDTFFADFANRIYAILGVFMLFYLAYALLNALVDPEKLAKGDKSVSKLAQNLIISLVMLGLLPSVFTYAYRLQNYILSSNLIGALVMGTKPTAINDNNESILSFGDSLSFTVLNAFINPTNENVNMSTDYNWYNFKQDVIERGDYLLLPSLSDAVVYGAPVAGSGSGEKKQVIYYAFISTAVGCYLIYVLLSFTLDLGVRIIKLAFCQLIAPIPIIMRAMPSKKGTFDKWLKLTLSVYFEVFIRVGIMYMSVYFVKALADNQIITDFIGDGVMGMFALVIVILGIFTFAKQAPKLISETLGIDSANLKLGIGEKLKAGGFFAGGSALGAAVTSGFNPFAIARAWNKGMKDGNFKSIGEEAHLRQEVLKARENGSTWRGRRGDDFRRYFGFDTKADAMDRDIDRLGYVDEHNNPILHNGNEVSKAYIERRKQELTQRNANIDENVRLKKLEVEAHDKTEKEAKNALDRAKALVNKGNSDYTTDITAGGITLTGNITQLKDALEQIKQASPTKLSGENDAAFQQRIVEHAKKVSEINGAIFKAEKTMANDIITDALRGTSKNKRSDGSDNIDNELLASITKVRESNATVTTGHLDFNSGDTLRNLEESYKDRIDQNSAEAFAIEQGKIASTHEIAELDRIEAVHKANQEALKQGDRYRAASANKNIKGGK